MDDNSIAKETIESNELIYTKLPCNVHASTFNISALKLLVDEGNSCIAIAN